MDIGGLLKELLLEDKVLIHFDFMNGFFDINKSVVVTWGVIAVLAVVILFLTSNMKVHDIGTRQLIAETIVDGLRGITGGMLGEEGYMYRDFMAVVLVFIGASNLVGLFGLTPATMDLNVTAGLAITSIVLVEAAGIIQKGFGKWLKGFSQPMAIVTPMNILELAIRPLSLCMRLFGNVIGATVIMELLKMVVPVVVPAAFSLYFDIFDGLIQAYVFVFLTSLYIKEAIE
ncbi:MULTISPECIES: F0F1 ATP synthase subunit A [unclassified Butyrivibrio]|uniref:F0F1 ATP synthase subunit A n=1 Tax=unclassified Butyrivibrio TaxID=2639466 RepID=UPI000404B5C2|nr:MULTISPECIES: F0F1 ATP synthase subunit A [unclassified Butyrivibrio]